MNVVYIYIYYRHTVARTAYVFIKHTGSYNIPIQSTSRLGGEFPWHGWCCWAAGTDDELMSEAPILRATIKLEYSKKSTNALLKIREGKLTLRSRHCEFGLKQPHSELHK